ncbi:V-type ATP synthase subunit E family protein [Arthrobacter sp. E3]|uniref:V-type ATP synthase subunit E family protein n=1 Tax=Arthrobacter sp. E3 TaxID=517402 RepID=UPI001A93B6D9|nr:V-type ATP synthase subunit E family protein [Arthrobacter sp. E3]
MTMLSPEADGALAPIREALRSAADEEASELREAARQQVIALLADSREQAALIVAAAVKDGEAAARSEAALRSSRVRREANELVLAQRSRLLQELRQQLRTRALTLQHDQRYPALVNALTQHCLDLLGAAASVSMSPDGGVIGEAGARRLDLSLPILAGMTLESMPEARELWNL